MKSVAGRCPYCGSESLLYESAEIQDDMVIYPFSCTDCDKSGYETYSMQFEGHDDENHRPVWVKQ
jgi:hypothetical protein